MASRTWQGPATPGGSNNWFVAANWTTAPPDPNNYPQPGDQVSIGFGEPTINATDPQPLANEQVTLGSSTFNVPAEIISNGATFDSNFTVDGTAAAPYAAIAFNQLSVFDGTIAASADSFAVSNDAPIQGSGTVSIEKGATVTFNDAVPDTQTVTFLDPNGTLLLNDVGAFAAKVTGFQAGDRIQVNQIVSSFTYAGGVLTLIGQSGPIGTIDLTPQGTMPDLFRIYVTQHNSVILSSQSARSWAGGSGDWYDPANWTSGVPLGGDSVSIGSGTASISAADVATYGVLDFETITLGTPGIAASATLDTDGASFGPELFITTAGQQQNSPAVAHPQAVLHASGTTLFDGTIQSVAQGGRLTIDAAGTSGPGNFIIEGAPPSQTNYATVSVSQESAVTFTGGTITNNGLVQVTGDATVTAGTSLQGDGTVELFSGGRMAIDGAVDRGQQIAFLDKTGILTLSNPGAFEGQIDFGKSGDRVDLPNVQAQSLSFDRGTLDLLSGGNVVASLGVSDPNGTGAADFTLAPDPSGQGSRVTYTPQAPVTLDVSLPISAVGNAGDLIPLTDLLVEAFGTVPPEYSQFTLSLPLGILPTTAYWDQQPGQEMDSGWAVNGQTIDQSMVVNAANIGSIELRVGNNLYETPSFTVPVATDAAGNPTEYVRYNIWTVAPAVNAPETAYSQPDPSVPGSADRFGRADAADEVASALRYSLVYPSTFNSDNCNWIADNVAAAAGATMPYDNYSTDPTQNLPGGFWRIVYRGSDSPNPVQDWFTLVQPGDVVRLGRQDQFGHHTTTVVGTVNPDGSLTVYDNADHNSAGQNIIGIHDATYWVGNDPSTITIYRLDPYHQYLIQGTSQSEFLQGSVFNNLIQPGGGNDTITAGAGSNEIQDTIQHLNGITVTDLHLGDTLDFTDLKPADASGSLDATGLAVMQSGELVANVSLPNIAAGQSVFAIPDGSGGTIFTLAPVSLDGYSPMGQAIAIQHLAPLAAAGRTTNIVSSDDGANMPAPLAGQYNVALITNPAAGSTVGLPSGYVASSDTHRYQAVIVQGSNAVSLVGPSDGDALLVGNQGDDVIAGFGPHNTLLAGSGNDVLFGGSEDSLLIGGPGDDMLLGGSGSSTLVGGSGRALMGGAGVAAVIGGTGQDTVVAGNHSETISANGDMLVFGAAGPLTFLNGAGSSTVVGATGSGSASINGGLGSGLFGGGTGGGNLILAGQGASTLFGGGSGDVMFAAGSAPDVLVAGAGNETLSGLGSSGDDVFFAGPGADLMGGGTGNAVFCGGTGQATVVATGGSDVYAYAKGVFAGGGTTILGFDPGKGDRIMLQGYAQGEVQNDLAHANVSGGSTQLTLSDGTALTFVGVTSLTSAAFA